MSDDAFAEVMAREIGDTGLTNLDLFLIGHQVLNTVGTTIMMRHASLAGVLDYTTQAGPEDHVSAHIVPDLLAWASGHRDKLPGCEDRLRRMFVSEAWLPHQLANVALEIGDAS